jgi:hypothetical protein
VYSIQLCDKVWRKNRHVTILACNEQPRHMGTPTYCCIGTQNKWYEVKMKCTTRPSFFSCVFVCVCVCVCIGVFSRVMFLKYCLVCLNLLSHLFLLSLLFGGKDYNTITVIRIFRPCNLDYH